MPRSARALANNCYYHVINRGNGRQQVFHKEGDYSAFLDVLLGARQKYSVKVLAWCLMPNHFHLLVQPEEATQLNKWMQWVMTTHVRRYHKHYGTSGHLWQGRYKSFIVQGNEHLLTIARYIEGNPVRAMLSPTAAQWAWSSHQVRNTDSKELQPDRLPFPLPEDWSTFVDTPLTDTEIEKVRNSVNRQASFGHENWINEICVRLGLESTLRRRGWPKGRKRKE
ncbi:transposase [Geobacter sp. FeAm09]|uniref:transposase n=1 Tax=Geobacter sp. FeAm09 TaxID=2597769 RepID=UPI0011ECEC3B|nr:transposase [Geobacter sp. FeAm09]QEM69719.1 transposase [Geobacter sp. FeAm09]